MARVGLVNYGKEQGVESAGDVTVFGAEVVARVLAIQRCDGEVSNAAGCVAGKLGTVQAAESLASVAPLAWIGVWRICHVDQGVACRNEES